ncbi:MAG: hypothetical protein O2960_21115 [Verrucomicrobia bacterium]|nr:hypothetical protein [Verrucomicrobiota bacterium]
MSFLSPDSIQPIEGILNATSRVEQSAQKISSGNLNPDHMVNLIRAQREVEANAAAIKTQQNVTETLLNILA